ncbi:MAG: VCBS repeat-containing protein, partial [Myxococcales bacterium]|nr:VCBS repeat-containing protein [Myxococcales bacterium]
GGYWRVDYPDGRRAFFGADSEGTIAPNARAIDPERGGTYEYHLVEMRDVHDHAMRLDWAKDGNHPLLQRVGYVYPDGPDSTYAVTLRYEDRRDETGGADLSSALGGFDLRLQKRLAEISVFARDQRIRRYRLRYEPYADAGGFTRLVGLETYGQRDTLHPIAFEFTYSRALGGLCGGGACPGPFMVDMGSIGTGLESGRVNLIDINGDGLPDVLISPAGERHVFVMNVPDPDGGSAFGPRVNSAFGDDNWRLDSGHTQLLDADGDGFADLINSRSGRVLFNEGGGDWARDGDLGDVAALPDFDLDFEVGETELGRIRFLDYDNDKRIDVLRSTRASTDIYRNLGGGGFQRDEGVVPLDAGIEDDNIEFADMNGDGLLDPVRLLPDAVSYRLNLGFGRWTEWRALQNVQLDAADIPLTALEDLNGDGLADLVTVTGDQVRVSLNRNGERFFQSQTFTSDDVQGMLPVRVDGVSVLFADMNANGSTDVVWIDREGQVDYLELYPVRPNLLSRIENGIGQVMDVAYGTSVQQQARDATPWAFALPHPMLVVESLDVWDRLSEEHEIDVFRYRDGYYDGAQKQFRGYARVERLAPGDDLHLDGRTVETYDVGAEDPYRHGLLLEAARYSDDALISVEATTYEDCAVAEVPAEP